MDKSLTAKTAKRAFGTLMALLPKPPIGFGSGSNPTVAAQRGRQRNLLIFGRTKAFTDTGLFAGKMTFFNPTHGKHDA